MGGKQLPLSERRLAVIVSRLLVTVIWRCPGAMTREIIWSKKTDCKLATSSPVCVCSPFLSPSSATPNARRLGEGLTNKQACPKQTQLLLTNNTVNEPADSIFNA